MRQKEYPMLRGITYLDHGGTTLTPKSLLSLFSSEMQATLLANPHSDITNPSASTSIIAKARQEVLGLFNADPTHFDIVFTANATASIKLVAEGLSGNEKGFDYYYHLNSHTSLVGVRELAIRSHCLSSREEMEACLGERSDIPIGPCSGRPTLFAYPAQSNMNGERLPLEWAGKLRASVQHPHTYTLLDAAALVSTSPLDLSDHLLAPDFTALSFYKIFGFPDLGALIVRKAAASAFDDRKYFGGGTTEMITCIDSPWVARKQSSLHARLEDGTIAIRSILALCCAIETNRKLFGGLEATSSHTAWLARQLFARLSGLRHANGAPICHIYKSHTSSYNDPKTQGSTLAFNIRRGDGSWIGCWHVGKALREDDIHVRTGSLCNPAGMASALGVDTDWLRRAFNQDFRCNTEVDVLKGVPIGMVRASLGAMSTLEDVDALVCSINRQFMEHTTIATASPGSSKSSQSKKGSAIPVSTDGVELSPVSNHRKEGPFRAEV
ncbi:hypothetical protein NX059_002888 [Plenodomus lindquistii]|nr:hypothetical protein NX059_002888 [Plenodomus lindquistii]